MELYKDEFVTYSLSHEGKVLAQDWTPATAQLEDDNFQHLMTTLVGLVERHKPQGLLVNTQQFQYLLTPSMQTWSAEHVLAKHSQNGVKKMALIVSQEMITQLSIEQTLEENTALGFANRYFSDIAEAEAWLAN